MSAALETEGHTPSAQRRLAIARRIEASYAETFIRGQIESIQSVLLFSGRCRYCRHGCAL